MLASIFIEYIYSYVNDVDNDLKWKKIYYINSFKLNNIIY